MEREELVQVVDRVYATWNQQLAGPQRKIVYEAWWELLKDLPVGEVNATITEFAVSEDWMPRPGHVRRSTVNRINGWNPPTKGEAWVQFRQMAGAAQSGTYDPSTQIHPIVARVVKQLGGPDSYSLHTNNDRELFLTQYEKELAVAEREMYQIS